VLGFASGDPGRGELQRVRLEACDGAEIRAEEERFEPRPQHRHRRARGERATRIDEVDVGSRCGGLAGPAQHRGDGAVVLALVGERPPELDGRARPELLRGERAPIKVEREQLGRDQQPRVREVAVRGRVGTRRGNEAQRRASKHDRGASAAVSQKLGSSQAGHASILGHYLCRCRAGRR
jgi:hypothetical protein